MVRSLRVMPVRTGVTGGTDAPTNASPLAGHVDSTRDDHSPRLRIAGGSSRAPAVRTAHAGFAAVDGACDGVRAGAGGGDTPRSAGPARRGAAGRPDTGRATGAGTVVARPAVARYHHRGQTAGGGPDHWGVRCRFVATGRLRVHRAGCSAVGVRADPDRRSLAPRGSEAVAHRRGRATVLADLRTR